MADFIEPASHISGSLKAPPDKSISHRALILGAMADGHTEVSALLNSADVGSTRAAVTALGARVEDGAIEGVGLKGAQQPDANIDAGNAGTLIRLLPGWLAAQGGKHFVLDGDESIRRRPMERIVTPLRLMGADIDAAAGGVPPLEITGSDLKGIEYELPVASAQVKSCILIAGLLAEGTTTVMEKHPSRDHTERMLASAGNGLELTVHADGAVSTEVAQQEGLDLGRVDVVGDFSSAAFALAAAVIVPGSQLVIEDVGVNCTRVGLLRVLERMGVAVEGEIEQPSAKRLEHEPHSELVICSSPLQGATVLAEEVPLLIDELPLVALLGCFAEGETVVAGAAELRVKESDRIGRVVDGLKGLGAKIEATDDGFIVEGGAGLRGGRVSSYGDHRLAMLWAVAGLVSQRGVEVEGIEAAAVSYPGFLSDLAQVVQ